jgi:hypothetical protein
MTATCGRTSKRQTPNAKRYDTMATAVFARSERAAPFWFLVRAKPGMQRDSRHYQAPNAHRRERCCLRRTV